MHTLQVLGGLTLRAPDGAVLESMLRQPKRAAILVYLTLEGRGSMIRRDHLLAMFWPESDASHSRGALRQALSFLRRGLGEGVILARGSEEVGIDPTALVCDVLLFEELVQDARPKEALELYQGDLLLGFHLPGTEGFQAWLDQTRELVRRGARDAAWRLSAEMEASGQASDAAYWGKRAVSYGNFGEGEVRRLLQLLDRVGDRLGALRAYRGLEERLQLEFDALPSPESKRLIEKIMARTTPQPIETSRRASRDRRGGVDRRSSEEGDWVGGERRVKERRVLPDRRDGLDRRGALPADPTEPTTRFAGSDEWDDEDEDQLEGLSSSE